jgi:ATP synthase protein I
VSTGKPPDDDMLDPIRRKRLRKRQAQDEGEPSFGRYLGEIGVLGWIVVTPMILGFFLGRWLDREVGAIFFWSAFFLIVGTVLGCWSAWRRIKDI